jgi:mevalonate kinase
MIKSPPHLLTFASMKTYPAKLLLFGEHTVNAGSQALAMPLPLFYGHWEYITDQSSELRKLQMSLPQFAEYLDRTSRQGELILPIDVAGFREALFRGLIFRSNIPRGYGAGSSGALVAAVFDSFHLQTVDDHSLLKKGLAQMESFFHGTSSGTDPLICFLQKPLLLGRESVRLLELPQASIAGSTNRLFLLDTGIERKATPLIEYFLKKMQEENFRKHCRNLLLPAVDGAIEAFLEQNWEKLFVHMHGISDFQLRFLEKMILSAFREIWQAGLESDHFRLKICGAGGGGFLLGISKNFPETEKALTDFRLLPVFG